VALVIVLAGLTLAIAAGIVCSQLAPHHNVVRREQRYDKAWATLVLLEDLWHIVAGMRGEVAAFGDDLGRYSRFGF
jgi:hypothetical protein